MRELFNDCQSDVNFQFAGARFADEPHHAGRQRNR